MAPVSRFGLAPPRRFVLPALLLLLTEEPGHGYSLESRLRQFRFGQIDRPMVYRALSQLDADGLVESRSEVSKVGQTRRVYSITSLGEQVLRVWMSVIKEERESLCMVLRRYQATGTADAALARVEGGWGSSRR
ncbi:MAG: helix-turn-helix transcriptional regulator [Actinomycetota bacterium]|nr:helix-turn-helix transcriptional regulator [Actinomycetota bacterium]MDQ6947165.1 helix-turn-helix transcriptional regulator [Actinomycetota bacterium]